MYSQYHRRSFHFRTTINVENEQENDIKDINEKEVRLFKLIKSMNKV